MIKSLTRIERSEFMKMAVVRLAHPAACSADVDEHDQTRIRLRYEYTLAQQDATIQERDIDVAECNLKLGMAKTFLAQSLAREEAKDATIEALALAVLNARAFPDEPKWAEEAHKLAREATHGDPEPEDDFGGLDDAYGDMRQ